MNECLKLLDLQFYVYISVFFLARDLRLARP